MTAADVFIAHGDGFLDAMADVWPECEWLRRARTRFDAATRRDRHIVITQFHAAMAPYYTRVRANDGSIFFETIRGPGVLASVHMTHKWCDPGIDDATRTTIFEWLQRLCDSAEAYVSGNTADMRDVEKTFGVIRSYSWMAGIF